MATLQSIKNSYNAAAVATNTAKVTNATHTGDVTGATGLTIATDAVDIAMLSATGTAGADTFLRGDNAWAEAGGGLVVGYGQAFSAPGGQWSKPNFGTGSAPSLTYTKLEADTTLFVYWTGGCSIFKGGSADNLVNVSGQFKEDGTLISTAATVTIEDTVGSEGGSIDFRGLYARTGLGTGDVVYQVEFRNDDGDWAMYNLGSIITVWEI